MLRTDSKYKNKESSCLVLWEGSSLFKKGLDYYKLSEWELTKDCTIITNYQIWNNASFSYII